MIAPGFTVSLAPEDVPVAVLPGHDYIVTRDSDGRRLGYVTAPGPDPEDGQVYEAHTAAGSGAYLGEHKTLDAAVADIVARVGDMQWPGPGQPGPGQDREGPEL